MSKGIVVVDIPNMDCRECQCFREQYPACGVVGRYIDPIVGRIPDWCPIRPLPEKRDEHSACYDSDYYCAEGWNDCLDELLKDGV